MNDRNVINTYAAFSKSKELRSASSSGAVFSELAQYILDENGVVYGAALSDDCKSAEYIRVTDKTALRRLRGAKYLQAGVGDAFSLVKADLEAGAKVLFTGTGCVINGLKLFLRKDYGNLLAVDIICHGAPSPRLWEMYIEQVEKKDGIKISTANFRDKKNGWSLYGLRLTGSKGEDIYTSKLNDPYLLMFSQNLSLRPSCYECIAKQNKLSDITLGDFWGIDDVLPGANDEKGISLVIIRTEKGQRQFERISDRLNYTAVDYEEAVKRNSAEYKSSTCPEQRENYFKDMETMDFEAFAAKYAAAKKRSLSRSIKETLKYYKKSAFGGKI